MSDQSTHNVNAEVRIRQANAHDASALAALGARTFTDSFAAYNQPDDLRDYLAKWFTPQQIESELRETVCTFLVAEATDGGGLTGYAKLRIGRQPPACVSGSNPIEIHRMYVLESWHGRGIGPALMNECLNRARAGGHDIIWLGVWDRNPRARAFYRKCGFIDVGEHIFQLGYEVGAGVERGLRTTFAAVVIPLRACGCCPTRS
jgi:ribosomal protein S18 acetylase RimI-like enzyme